MTTEEFLRITAASLNVSYRQALTAGIICVEKKDNHGIRKWLDRCGAITDAAYDLVLNLAVADPSITAEVRRDFMSVVRSPNQPTKEQA